jgi:hypothetical protein
MQTQLLPGQIVAQQAYRFSVQQAELEVATGFLLLQLQASAGSIRTLLAFRAWPTAEQRSLAIALVKWIYREVLATMGEPPTADELAG